MIERTIETALIVDVETNGLDPQTCDVIEIGLILYSVRLQTVLSQQSRLFWSGENGAYDVNRIPVEALQIQDPNVSPCDWFLDRVRSANVVVAHNAEFDSQWLPDPGVPWLCTMTDFKWPRASRESGSLVNLALDHGIGVASAHRALTDCQLIAALFDRMDDLPGMFAHAMRPARVWQAVVPFERKDLAKDAGFKWHPDAKVWLRRMADDDVASLPFQVREWKC